MGISTRIKDDAGRAVHSCSMKPIYKSAFVIALIKLKVEIWKGRQNALFEIGQCNCAISLRLAESQQVQVGAIKNKDLQGIRRSKLV